MAAPHLILIGYGVTDTLQLTVEAQRTLSRFGSAYSLGLPPNLAAFLKSQRVKVTDLAPALSAEDPAEGYLAAAEQVLRRCATERPVILLAPGHPLMFNSIGRYLASEGRRLGLALQVVPALSQLDAIIGGIGLDVSTFGLQVFDCQRLVARDQSLNPGVPLLLMHAGTLSAADGAGVTLGQLSRLLQRCYPARHPVVLVSLAYAGVTVKAVPLEELPAAGESLTAGSHLFLDAIRTPQGSPA